MVELIGDVCIPSELILPTKTSASLPATAKDGTLFYDVTIQKIVFWDGGAWRTVTSA